MAPSKAFHLPHDNYGPRLNITIWVLTGVSALFLGLRVYCKFLRHRRLWWDDYFLVFSWLALVASSALLSICVSLGYGHHFWDIKPKNFHPLLMISNAAGFALIVGASWSKTSFAITLLRISNGWITRVVWFVIITINIVFGVNGTIQWIQCWPVDKMWHPWIKGSCWPKEILIQYNIFSAAYSGAMDILLALLPWKILWSLTMNKKEKIGMMLAMSMGVFAGITSLLKIVTVSAIGSSDIIDAVNLLIFGSAECATTIVAASIPVLRILIRDTQSPPSGFYREGQWKAYPTSEDSTVASQLQSHPSIEKPSQPPQQGSKNSGRRNRWFRRPINTDSANART